jgi:hypothetical protein
MEQPVKEDLVMTASYKPGQIPGLDMLAMLCGHSTACKGEKSSGSVWEPRKKGVRCLFGRDRVLQPAAEKAPDTFFPSVGKFVLVLHHKMI